mmetsp:Transcript_1319/g.2379  ORF Transcript_1319/g.2379 Transcript_1319/m.2379 type:complete len:209 (+) Transcript_1319:468-1094(+)
MRAPAAKLPARTGIKFLKITAPRVTGAPSIMARGRMNRFAMLCSSPIPTKVEMANQIPTILPARSLAAVAMKTAIDTIQLHITALVKVGMNPPLHLLTAVEMANAEDPGFMIPATMAAAAKRPHPTTFPAKDTAKFVHKSSFDTNPSYLAAVTVAELPVNSWPDVETIKRRLTGKSAAKAILATPGLAAAIPPRLPAMASEMSPPKPT